MILKHCVNRFAEDISKITPYFYFSNLNIFQVLHLSGSRPDLNSDAVKKMYGTSASLLGMVSFTMQDAANTLRLMYELNVMPLALQITTIAGIFDI